MAWPVNARTSAMMDEAQALYGATITATQGSPNPGGVGASAGTHDGEGVIDVVGADLDAIVIAMRQVGFAAWHRTPAQGFTPHVHGVAVAEPGLSPQAATQVQSYVAGRNGLRGNGPDDGPRDWVGVTWETYSGGTYVPPTDGGGGGDPVPVLIHDQFPGDRSGTYTFDPGGILAGAPFFTYSGSPVAFNRMFAADIDDTPAAVTLNMTAGDSIASGPLYDWAYNNFTDLARGYWMVRATGDAVLEVADAYDVDFEYPFGSPTWVPRELVGSDGEFLYYEFDPTYLDAEHLNDAGQMLIRITCVSGSAEITFIGIRIEQIQGFYLEEDFIWSDTAPASSREPETSSDTFDKVLIGGVNSWVVDGEPVLHPVIDGLGNSFLDWRGSDTSLIDAQHAIDGANVDFHAHGSAGIPDAYVSLQFTPAGVSLGGPHPNSWAANIKESVTYLSVPSKSTLDDAIPAEYYARQSWEAGDFEWIDTDPYLLGWHQYGEDDNYIEVQGDGCTVNYSLITSATGDEDLSSGWFTTGAGTLVATGTVSDTYGGTLNPGGIPVGPAQVPIDETFISTTNQLIYQRLELDRRFTNQVDQFTTENGYSAGNEGTGATLHVPLKQLAASYRIPPWRYQIPVFRSAPGPAPTIDFDEDLPLVTWLRQRQRNDGLGSSVIRARGASSRQMSLRQRGYR